MTGHFAMHVYLKVSSSGSVSEEDLTHSHVLETLLRGIPSRH